MDSLTTTFGLIVVVLATILQIERELLRAYADDRNAPRARWIQFATSPLLLISTAIIGARLASLAI